MLHVMFLCLVCAPLLYLDLQSSLIRALALVGRTLLISLKSITAAAPLRASYRLAPLRLRQATSIKVRMGRLQNATPRYS